MKGKWFYIFTLFLCGMFAFSFAEARNNTPSAGRISILTIKSSSTNHQKQPVGDSPFIRFHHGIDENGVAISSPNELIISLKPLNGNPQKFAGIFSYLSSLDFRLPVTREIYYSTPLRSPPFFC